MNRHFLDTTRVNPLEKKNPPKYLENLEGFLKVFGNVKASKSEIEEVVETLKDFKAEEFWNLYDLEEEIKSLESKYEKARSYRSLLSFIEKIEEAKEKRRGIKARITSAQRYIELLEERQRLDFKVIEQPVKRRNLYTSSSDIRKGHEKGNVIYATTDVELASKTSFNKNLKDQLKNLVSQVMETNRIKNKKSLKKDEQGRTIHDKRIVLRLDFPSETPKIEGSVRDELIEKFKNEYALSVYRKVADDPKLLERWLSAGATKRAKQMKAWKDRPEAMRYALKKIADKESGKEPTPKQEPRIYKGHQISEPLTCLSTKFTRFTSKTDANFIYEQLLGNLQSLIDKYHFSGHGIQIGSASIIERSLDTNIKTSSREWVDNETGEIFEEDF